LAMRFIDFAMQPKVQAELTKFIAYGPTNREAFKHVSADVVRKLPSNPEWVDKGFDRDGKWWGENLDAVTSKWRAWMLQGRQRWRRARPAPAPPRARPSPSTRAP